MRRGRPSSIRHDVPDRRTEIPSIVDLVIDPELAPLVDLLPSEARNARAPTEEELARTRPSA